MRCGAHSMMLITSGQQQYVDTWQLGACVDTIGKYVGVAGGALSEASSFGFFWLTVAGHMLTAVDWLLQ